MGRFCGTPRRLPLARPHLHGVDLGVGVAQLASEGRSVLHVKFGAVKPLIDEDVFRLKRLLALGVDVIARNNSKPMPFSGALPIWFAGEFSAEVGLAFSSAQIDSSSASFR